MSELIRRPSSAASTYPFQLTQPVGWTATEPPGALLVLLGPELDGFRSNVIVSASRISGSADLGALAAAAFDDCDPASVLGPVLPPPLTEHRLGVAVRRGITVVGGRQLARLGVVIAADEPDPTGPRSVFGLLGTWPADRTDPDETTVTGIISSFRPVPRGADSESSRR